MANKNKKSREELNKLYREKLASNPALRNKISERKRLSVFSRHPTHDVFRSPLIKLAARTSIRFGSQTIGPSEYEINLNKPDAVKTSANKLLMKKAFASHGVVTAIWYTYNRVKNVFVDGQTGEEVPLASLPFPIVSKQFFGSRGRGNAKHNNAEEFQEYLNSVANPSNMIFERYYNYATEYRVHVNAITGECFYNLRKMRKHDTPESERWYRNDKNSVWVTEDSDSGLYDKPVNWSEISEQCVRALNAVGLDLGAIDVRIQSSTNSKGETRSRREFIILETNSAPSFGDRTANEYLEQIKKIAESHANKKTKYPSPSPHRGPRRSTIVTEDNSPGRFIPGWGDSSNEEII